MTHSQSSIILSTLQCQHNRHHRHHHATITITATSHSSRANQSGLLRHRPGHRDRQTPRPVLDCGDRSSSHTLSRQLVISECVVFRSYVIDVLVIFEPNLSLESKFYFSLRFLGVRLFLVFDEKKRNHRFPTL